MNITEQVTAIGLARRINLAALWLADCHDRICNSSQT
jgi:hypothetical protein